MKILPLAILLTVHAMTPAAWAQTGVSPAVCGNLANGDNGPFDYRTERGPRLKVVEDHHFNARVEALLGGQTGSLEHDLDYLLRAFPNHHRGLVAIARLSVRNGGLSRDPAVQRTADCYFERALRWRPDDTIARMLYAKYLHDTKHTDLAVQQLDRTIVQAADNAFTQYNIGLLFAEMGLMDRALEQAHLARRMGFLRADLADRLKAVGKWQEPLNSTDLTAPAQAEVGDSAQQAAPIAAKSASAPAQ